MSIPLANVFANIFCINKQAIEYLYNVQHDCPFAKCTASGKRPLMQERIHSGLSTTYIEHKPIERFVINTHAFHNAHRLRASLGRSLVAPVPLFPPNVREQKHAEFALSLRLTQKAKVEARAARKKKDKNSATDKTETVIPKKRARSDIEATEAGTAEEVENSTTLRWPHMPTA